MSTLFFDGLKVILRNPIWWILSAIVIFVLRVISLRHKYKKREPSTYSDLIKQYREKYGETACKMPECVKEIQERALNNFHITKTPSEIITDLKQIGAPAYKGTLSDKSRSGGILLVAKMPIHTSLLEICQIFIRKNDIYITNNYYSDCGILCLNTSNCKRQFVLWNHLDWKRFSYNRYIVSSNTALHLIAEMIQSILTSSDNSEITTKCIAKLNSCLHTYKIHTEMTQKSWNFFFDNTPISLEEVIRKLPDDILLRGTSSISQDVPTLAQKKPSKPSPTVVKNSLSQKEYLSQLEDLCYKFGDDAKRHLANIQRQTGYNRKKVEGDLEKVRGQLKSLPPQKQPQSKPNLSIEEELLNYLKAQPICWEFPLTTQDKALNQFCEALVFSENVAAASSTDTIKELELTIQKKRARNPRLADHNAAMEGNILAMLYEYSYLMHIFHALDDMKFDTTKVDIQKLWLLIQQDCNARINNLNEEKRKNPTIQIVLDKYNYDHQITRLKVLNDATGREMDYIISFIMAYSLLNVISLLLGNPKLLQPLKSYSADDIAGMMNALVNTSAGLRFTAYSR